MTAPDLNALARSIRGAYTNVPLFGPGMCKVCSAPTTGPQYDRCVPCDSHAFSGHALASGGVIPLSWAPMVAAHGYSAQGYVDLSGYKEDAGTPQQIARLKALMYMSVLHFGECVLPEFRTRPFAVAHVPSTSGTRLGEHPVQKFFEPMFTASAPRVRPEYVGTLGGDRNSRRALKPENWEVDIAQVGDAKRVLIIDDTWVTGGHAQSLASAFEREGLKTRVLVLGRALDPGRGDHGAFLKDHAASPFDTEICPVHRVRHDLP